MIDHGYWILLTLLGIGNDLATYTSHDQVRLNYSDYWISPRTTYEQFRVQVYVAGNDTVHIEKAIPSCGCVMATIQKNKATRSRPGEVYVAITSAKVDPLQPTTIDIYTSENRNVPKRIYIRRTPTSRLK